MLMMMMKCILRRGCCGIVLVGILCRQCRQLAPELFVFSLQTFDVDVLGCPHVSFYVFNRIAGPFGLFVQAHQDFGQGLQDARLFQIFSEFLLFGTITVLVAVAVAVVVVGGVGVVVVVVVAVAVAVGC